MNDTDDKQKWSSEKETTVNTGNRVLEHKKRFFHTHILKLKAEIIDHD
eukprot:UN00305